MQVYLLDFFIFIFCIGFVYSVGKREAISDTYYKVGGGVSFCISDSEPLIDFLEVRVWRQVSERFT